MKKVSTLLLLLLIFQFSNSQTYQLEGTPVNTTGWSLVADAKVENDFILLTPDIGWKNGAIKLDESIQLNSCDKWTVEFDFRIDGNGTPELKMGDGIAFWYIANPPVTYENGAGLGIPPDAVGLMVGFDTFNNEAGSGEMSKIHVLYGVNMGDIEKNKNAYHSDNLQATLPFVGSTYKKVIVTGERDALRPQQTWIKLWLDGNLIFNRPFVPAGLAATMTRGYFGFSASTGGASSRHSIKNVKVFVDRVPVLTKEITPLFGCPSAENGQLKMNLKSLEREMIDGVNNYTIDYLESDGTRIPNPENYTFSSNKTIMALVGDKTGTLCSSEIKIHMKGEFIDAKNASLNYCGTSGRGIYNLEKANVTATDGIRKEYYHRLTDLDTGTNKIENTTHYETEIFSDIYVKLILPSGCYRYAKIKLMYSPKVKVKAASLKECTSSWDISEAVFNLREAEVTEDHSANISYHTSRTDAYDGVRDIPSPLAYSSASATVYARVMPTNGCFDVAEITLKAAKPVQIAKVDVKGSEITVRAVGGEAPLHYSLDGENWTDSHVLTVSQGGVHMIFVKDNFSCNTAQYKIIILNLPNIITPNGDGKNDRIDFELLADKSNLRFEIFDRYGKLVFSNRSSSQLFWDGTFAGRPLPDAAYWYVVSWNEADFAATAMNYTGWIYLKNAK